ncbi:MAG TPA: hypothetical protein PLP17_14040, partial [Oligoflexia bacterium]|nr:hypothetical protein [Oligoflexia bacterium]
MSREDFERSFTFTPASAPPVVNVLGPRLLMRGTFVLALLSAAAAMLPRSAAAAELLAVDTVSLRRAGKASSVSLLIDGSGFDAATSFSVVDSEGAVRAASKLQVLSTKQAIA